MVCIPQSSRARETADRRFAVGLRSRDRGFEVQVPGYRYYSPGLGRWVNRDPIGERGGPALYGLAENRPVDDVDSYGLYTVPWPRLPIWPFPWSRYGIPWLLRPILNYVFTNAITAMTTPGVTQHHVGGENCNGDNCHRVLMYLAQDTTKHRIYRLRVAYSMIPEQNIPLWLNNIIWISKREWWFIYQCYCCPPCTARVVNGPHERGAAIVRRGGGTFVTQSNPSPYGNPYYWHLKADYRWRTRRVYTRIHYRCQPL